jgi:hypothetical protein
LNDYSTNKGLIFRIYKEPKNYTLKEQTLECINGHMNWTEDVQMASKATRKFFNMLRHIREAYQYYDPFHHGHNGNYPENKEQQIFLKMWWKGFVMLAGVHHKLLLEY